MIQFDKVDTVIKEVNTYAFGLYITLTTTDLHMYQNIVKPVL